MSVLVSLLVGAGVALLAYGKTATYRSTATLAIDQPRAISLSEGAGVLDKLARLRFKHAGLVQTQTFRDELHNQAGTAKGGVRAIPLPATLLTQVVATSSSANDARVLAEAAADLMRENADEEQAAANIDEKDRYSFTVVSPASAAIKIGPTAKKSFTSGAVAAVIALVALVLLSFAGAAANRRS